MFEPRTSEDPSPSRHLSSFHLEALRLGAATEEERARMEGHLASCRNCQEAAQSWRASLAEFDAGALGQTRTSVGARVVRASSVARRRWMSGLGALTVAAAAAAALVVVWRPRAHERTPDATLLEPGVREKGGLDFVVAVRRGDHIFHADAEPVRTGDQIRFAIDGTDGGYVMVGSVDSSGRASIYVPYEGRESVAIPAGARARGRFEIEGSIVLDATPGPERIFSLVSQRPLPAGPVRNALATIGEGGASAIRGAKELVLPSSVVARAGGLVQRTILLEKRGQ